MEQTQTNTDTIAMPRQDLEQLMNRLALLLKDTATVIVGLQAEAKLAKLESEEGPAAAELKMQMNAMKSLSTRLSLERNHNDFCVFLATLAGAFSSTGDDTKKLIEEELEVEQTDILEDMRD